MNQIDYARLDRDDPLAHKREIFELPNDTIYFDGNSLGALPKIVAQTVNETTREQWGNDLIKSWNQHDWVNLPTIVGAKIAHLIGAQNNEVICCDSISVNLFKVICAAINAVGSEKRRVILSTRDNFPTDLYMVQGVESFLGQQRCELKLVDEAELVDAIDERTVAVLATEVNFRTGRRLDLQQLSQAAHAQGALMIADLAHSAGVMPIQLSQWQVDYAIGCTYKYLNAGPGAPAFVYVSQRHHAILTQPLQGWFGHLNPFAFEPKYQSAKGIRQMLVGTPPVISMQAVNAALECFNDVSLAQVRAKSMQLTHTFQQSLAAQDWSSDFELISPSHAEQRGSQLSYAHPNAYEICQALIERGVIADFRAPNYIRFGFAPLYNQFQEVERAIAILADIMSTEAYRDPRWQTRSTVT
ncbi:MULTISPECIES: kynureninase [Idiomarina]|nr:MULTISPECIES: kynureninase [Idiomarina]MBR38032.1 kynureninase [Idiomarina sp.]